MRFFFLMIRRPPRSTPLSLHDALPIFFASGVGQDKSVLLRMVLKPPVSGRLPEGQPDLVACRRVREVHRSAELVDRKSTRLNSSHANISYAVFCLKKKKIELHLISYSN